MHVYTVFMLLLYIFNVQMYSSPDACFKGIFQPEIKVLIIIYALSFSGLYSIISEL